MEVNIKEIARKIEQLIMDELPGETSHSKMTPRIRRSLQSGTNSREAAVMILFFQENRDIKLALIKRTEYEGVHSGQISFPGGMKEAEDPDLQSTSIRETVEETGIKEKELRILGELSPIHIPVSNFRVCPYVAYMSSTPIFTPDPVEVDHIINIPLKHLLNYKNRKKEKWNLSGEEIMVPFYSYKNYKIWGATAMILSEFLDIIEEVEPYL
ncbi:MAG: NUDIX hydrolase [Bacteroidota bacterium]